MKVMLICMTFLVMSVTQWETDFHVAAQKARNNNKVLLLNFSGSDWCIPCIRMHKDIFETDQFNKLSDSLLVLYNADFPRKKKNQLAPSLSQQNDSLAAKYNPEGKFPFTLLLSPDGKILGKWEGYPENGIQAFLNSIKKVTHDYYHLQ